MEDKINSIETQDISLKELFFILKSNLKSILLSISICLFIGSIYLLSVNQIYNSSSKILIDSSSSGMSTIFDAGLGSDINYLENEIEILKSRSTAERVITSLLKSEYKDSLHLFNTRKFNNSFIKQTLRNALFLDWNNTYIVDIDKEINDDSFNNFVESLQKNISISNLRNTDVLKVSYSSNNAEEAALIANSIIDVYQKRDQEWANGEMRYLKQFLSEQLKVKENELNKIEQDLKEFQEKEHIYGLDDNSNLLLNQLTSLESDYYNTEAKKNILLERKKYFSNQLNENEKVFTSRVTNTLDAQLYSIRQELSSLQADYISTKSREGESHPAVIDLDKKINSLKEILNKKTKSYIKQGISVANPIEYRQALMDSVINIDIYISGYTSKLQEMKNLVNKYEKNLSLLPEKYLQFSRFQRDKVILDETYTLMKQKLEESKINEASQLGKIRIVDLAKPDLKPVSPSKKLVLILSFIFGILLGLGFIFAKEFLDSTIKSIEELERRGLSILAIIPSIGVISDKRKNKKKGYKIGNKSLNIERRLLTHEDPKSPISEAYRTLRTSLTYVDNSDCKIFLVSSPGPGEGKTTTVANLAITYANMGKKTLLIDADLRKPVLHKMFKRDEALTNIGLSNILTDNQKNIDDIFYGSGIDNLSIISSGAIPPNPSELLSSENMNLFLEKIKSKFDIILFDTPPLIAVTDAFIVAKHIDKFLLVVRASVTQKGALERSLTNMSNMDQQIHGAIFNGVDDSSTYGGGYYYNYYQNYYGDDSK